MGVVLCQAEVRGFDVRKKASPAEPWEGGGPGCVLWGDLWFPPVSTPSAVSILLLSNENSDGTQK